MSHLQRHYYCAVTNVKLTQEISAPTRYVLIDNLTQGELVDYKEIGNQTAFIGNSTFEFAFVGGVFGSNDRMNGTSNRLFVNGNEVATKGNIGQVTSALLSSPKIILLEATIRYNSLSSIAMRSGVVIVQRKFVCLIKSGLRRVCNYCILVLR